jgi:hypothetical protein
MVRPGKEVVPMRRLIAVLAVLLSVAGVRAQSDHLECFKVKDPQAKAEYTAIIDGLVLAPGCRVKVPAATACVPATKTIIGPPYPPGGGGTGVPNAFLCYKAKCPKTTLPTFVATDQFGSRSVTPSARKLVCAPLTGFNTTIPNVLCPSDNCHGDCIFVNGQYWVDLGDALQGNCSLPFPVCSSTTTTTATTTSSTTITAPGPSAQLLATGQTTCWNSIGTVIPCAGTGQDGEVQAGAPLAYVDNGDGTVTDANTGLTWEKKSDDGSIHDKDTFYTWDNAFAVHVAGLNSMNFAGHNDWRVPNRRELQSIVDDNTANPAVSPVFNTSCVPGCTVLTCSCTVLDYYWSSTTYFPISNDARVVHFLDGTDLGLGKGSLAHVRAVRGGA